MARFRLVVLAATVTLVAVACSGSDSVTVEDPWGRPSPMSAGNAAFYMDLNGGAEDDQLVAASASVCGVTELHETMMEDGVMSMQPRPEGFDVPADTTVSLEPGGLHVMCLDVQEPLVVGESVDIELEFANTGAITVSAEIREQ